MFGTKQKETKEEKAQKNLDAMMARYGLENLSNPNDQISVRNIVAELNGQGLMKTGILLSGKSEDIAKLSYLSALVEQNWIMIRQLDAIASKLDK